MYTFPRLMWMPLLLAVGAAAAEGGLSVSVDETPWPRWQARLGLAASPMMRGDFEAAAGQQLHGAKLLGDYYFSGPGFGEGRVAGGFRATSGVMVGTRGSLVGMPTLGAPRGISLTVSRSALSGSNAVTDGSEPMGTAPYFGLGYTSLSARGGWGFSADIGLLAVNQGNGLRVDSTDTANTRSFDDVMRDLRLTPMVQLGVSYSF